MSPRDVREQRDAERNAAPTREHECRDRAEHREHETFRQQLTYEPTSSHAKREPHGNFATTTRTAREQQVGDVGAGDEQDDGRNAAEPECDSRALRLARPE